jgi:hypothetical protein
MDDDRMEWARLRQFECTKVAASNCFEVGIKNQVRRMREASLERHLQTPTKIDNQAERCDPVKRKMEAPDRSVACRSCTRAPEA